MFPLKDNIPKDRFALVTVVLIAINVVVYLLGDPPRRQPHRGTDGSNGGALQRDPL
jgi:hypothetical protein